MSIGNNSEGIFGGIRTNIGWEGTVNDFTVLPNVIANAGKLYLVLNSTLSGLLLKRKGLYRSDGVSWTRMGALPSASNISYTNSTSGLLATDVQGALDENNNLIKSKNIITVTNNYNILNTDFSIIGDATANKIIITLPLVSNTGFIFNIQKIDNSGNILTLKGNGIELINGQNTIDLTQQYTTITVQSDGTKWIIL